MYTDFEQMKKGIRDVKNTRSEKQNNSNDNKNNDKNSSNKNESGQQIKSRSNYITETILIYTI